MISIPEALEKGDVVAIISTARKISKEEIEPAIKQLKKWGLKVKLGKHLFDSHNQFAGTDEVRSYDFQQAISDPDVKAILCARGGYGSIRILDKVDFSYLPASLPRNIASNSGYRLHV